MNKYINGELHYSRRLGPYSSLFLFRFGYLIRSMCVQRIFYALSLSCLLKVALFSFLCYSVRIYEMQLNQIKCIFFLLWFLFLFPVFFVVGVPAHRFYFLCFSYIHYYYCARAIDTKKNYIYYMEKGNVQMHGEKRRCETERAKA